MRAQPEPAFPQNVWSRAAQCDVGCTFSYLKRIHGVFGLVRNAVQNPIQRRVLQHLGLAEVRHVAIANQRLLAEGHLRASEVHKHVAFFARQKLGEVQNTGRVAQHFE